MRTLLKAPLFGLLIVIIYFTTYAFASTQTSQFPQGGEAANQISGWSVSNVHYSLAEGSGKLSAVEFDLDSAAGLVQISLNSSSALDSCVNTSDTHWVCDTNSMASLANADQLRVIATGK